MLHVAENPSAPRIPSTMTSLALTLILSKRHAKTPVATPTANPMNTALTMRNVGEKGGVNTKPF